MDVRGTDPDCSEAISSSNGPQDFTWQACTETKTLALDTIPNPITGSTAIQVTAGSTASGILVGDTDPPTQANGWTYNPPLDDNTSTVTFYAEGTGDCGTLTDSVTVNIDTMVAPTVTAFTVPATVIDTSAPLTVPVTSFTATDNVAVTGYMVTETATVPGAGDAGWTGTAPASYDVQAGYGSYTLYAWAKDAAGNVSVSASAPVTVSDCTETATVSLDAVPATITGPIAITATLGGSGGSSAMIRWKVDTSAWSSWQASGTTFTPPDNAAGSVQFEAKATGFCGADIFDSANPTGTGYDTRTDDLEVVGVPSAVQAGLTGINVTFIYCNDKNKTGRFQVDYKLASSGSWTIGTPVADGGPGDADGIDNESVLIQLTGLTMGETYDLRMTYIDATDGVTGTAVHTTQLTLTIWSDDSLLHNALRFACSEQGYSNQTDCETNGGTWDLDRKHAGGWGTDVGAYGPIICSTCHDKNTGNIKRIKANVVSTNTGSEDFPGSAVAFNTAEDGTSEFGDDGGDHVSSNRICEVCHTVTDYHRYDTTGQPGGTSHYNRADCLKCHEHKIGFRAGCTACHDSPPLDAGGLVTTDPTGSATWGEHQKHALDLAYECNTCHNGWQANGEMPNTGNLNIGFVTPGTDGGTYDGRSAGAGYNADGSTTVTTGDALTCAVYCHGYQTPVWDPASTADCGACHGEVGSYGDDRAGAPTGGTSLDLSGAGAGYKVGKHANHLDDSLAETGDPCALCHDGFGYADASHVDGTVNVNLHNAAGVTASFGAGSPGTCSNMDCHGDANWDSAAVGGCTLCHDYPPKSGGNHAAGVNPVNHDMFSANGVPSNHDNCTYCHGYKDNGSGALLVLTVGEITNLKGDPAVQPLLAGYHMDGSVTLNGNANATGGDDAGYNSGNAGCDSAACHGNDASHRFNGGSSTGNTIQLADIGPGSCSTCHDTGVGGAPVVTSGSNHTSVTRGAAFGDCTDCHSGHYASGDGVQIPNNTNVGIDYSSAGHGGIMLGGTGTHSSISGKSTEAEICWGCHTNDGTVSEWGQNNGDFGITYDYGALSNNAGANGAGWYSDKRDASKAGATWTSAVGDFSYKTGAIKSTHSANTAGTAAIGGTAYSVGGMTETLDAVANIRCSYCHNVHFGTNGGGVTAGAPYLRGTWKGNPYNEDGAPLTAHAGNFTSQGNIYGPVPRGSAATNNNGGVGGYWIDQNSGNPNNGETLTTTAGLCKLCHSQGYSSDADIVNNMDYTTGEALWVGTNGHSAAVIGGNGSFAANIFTYAARGGTGTPSTNTNSNTRNVQMGRAAETNRGYTYRGNGDGGYGYWPTLSGSRPYAFQDYAWGDSADGSNATISAGTTQLPFNTTSGTPVANYHTFNCGKCHNPHASRLPKLMITNCLDTNHNTWQSAGDADGSSGQLTAGYNAAQNCHRRHPDGADGSETHSGTAYGAGWNSVTPW
jgi:hypothetical protein